MLILALEIISKNRYCINISAVILYTCVNSPVEAYITILSAFHAFAKFFKGIEGYFYALIN